MNKLSLTNFNKTLLILAVCALAGGVFVHVGTASGDDVADDTSGLPYYGSADFTPHWFEGRQKALSEFHRIPEFQFTNQNGETVTEKEIENGVYVASFFFSTCPGICPMIRSRLSKVQDYFLDDESVKILSHSIRPQTDTVDVLQAYANSNGVVAGKWHLLTGEREAIYELARQAYFADEDLGDPDSVESFLHTENLLLIDQHRHIRGVYNGRSKSSVANLITDIETLLNQ